MKLAFSGEARYPVFTDGFGVYSRRVRSKMSMRVSSYCKVVKMYCASLAERLYNDGIVDLPMNLGQIAAATITRKPVYRKGKFIGYGKFDIKTGQYDGKLKTFGIVFLPNRDKKAGLRCFGFVANRKLFKRMKARYESDDCPWVPIEFNDDMI